MFFIFSSFSLFSFDKQRLFLNEIFFLSLRAKKKKFIQKGKVSSKKKGFFQTGGFEKGFFFSRVPFFATKFFSKGFRSFFRGVFFCGLFFRVFFFQFFFENFFERFFQRFFFFFRSVVFFLGFFFS